jgi:hypothetical protein
MRIRVIFLSHLSDAHGILNEGNGRRRLPAIAAMETGRVKDELLADDSRNGESKNMRLRRSVSS